MDRTAGRTAILPVERSPPSDRSGWRMRDRDGRTCAHANLAGHDGLGSREGIRSGLERRIPKSETHGEGEGSIATGQGPWKRHRLRTIVEGGRRRSTFLVPEPIDDVCRKPVHCEGDRTDSAFLGGRRRQGRERGRRTHRGSRLFSAITFADRACVSRTHGRCDSGIDAVVVLAIPPRKPWCRPDAFPWRRGTRTSPRREETPFEGPSPFPSIDEPDCVPFRRPDRPGFDRREQKERLGASGRPRMKYTERVPVRMDEVDDGCPSPQRNGDLAPLLMARSGVPRRATSCWTRGVPPNSCSATHSTSSARARVSRVRALARLNGSHARHGGRHDAPGTCGRRDARRKVCQRRGRGRHRGRRGAARRRGRMHHAQAQVCAGCASP